MKAVRGLTERKSIPDLVKRSAQASPDQPFIRWIRPTDPEAAPEEINYAEFEERVRRAIAVFQAAGLKPGDRVLFLAENSPTWQVLAIAAQALRVEVASLFVSLGSLDAVDIACRVLPKLVFVSSEVQWMKLEAVLRSLRCCSHVVFTDPALTFKIPDPFTQISNQNLKETPPIPPEEFYSLIESIDGEDPFIIIFTSGTTGRQKGVRIPQRAVMAAIEAGVEATDLSEKEVGLHILPFGHIAGLGAFYSALKTQSTLILCSRREDLLRGFAERPTYTLLVPLLYERVWKEVLRKIYEKPAPIARFLKWLLKSATAKTNGQGLPFKDRALRKFARILVGAPLRSQLGGRIQLLAAGGALSDPEMIAFYRGLGFEYLNLYGMSETAGIIALNSVGDAHMRLDSVGKPWKTVEVKIAEDGEILVHGKTMMSGYLEKEGDREAYAPDGYFRTGDLGWMDSEGYLYITGRKKNTFVLSTGKKVSPELIELKLREILPEVTDVVLVGDGEAFVSAALFVTQNLLSDLKVRYGENEIKNYFLSRIRRGFSRLSNYETPKQVFFIEGAPYDYPKMITPTLKIKRNVFARLFSSQIREIYRDSSLGQTKIA